MDFREKRNINRKHANIMETYIWKINDQHACWKLADVCCWKRGDQGGLNNYCQWFQYPPSKITVHKNEFRGETKIDMQGLLHPTCKVDGYIEVISFYN
jgi:hypothetical protein